MTVDVENARQPLVKNNKKMPQFGKIFEIIKHDDVQELQQQVEKESLEMVLMPQDSQHYKTALHAAVDSAAMDCLKILLEGNPTSEALDSPDADGNTPLHTAVSNLNGIAVVKLLEAGAYPNARTDQGQTALHLLAYKASSAATPETKAEIMNCVKPLIEHNDIDLNAVNNSHLTPLKISAAKFPTKSVALDEFCRKLIENGALVEDKTREILDNFRVPYIKTNAINQKKKTLPLADIYNLLITGKHENLQENLKKLSTQDARDVANRYLGSKRIMYYLVDKCNAEGVSILLRFGAKPWSRNMGGELPLHRALARGHHAIVSSLIEHMKKTNMNRKVDIREESYSLIQKALQCRNTQKLSEIDSNKCLRRIFESDVLVNVNQKEKEDNQTALHVAAAMNNQEAMSILLENGAYLGEHRIIGLQDHGTVLNAIMPKTLHKAMDNCIHTHQSHDSEEDMLDPEYTLEMNYGFLLPPQENENTKTPSYHNEAAVLFDVSLSKEHHNSLKHPLIQTLLYAKWRRVLPLYALNLIIYLTFVLLLTAFMYSLKNLRLLQRNEANGNFTDFDRMQERISEYQTQSGVIMTFVLIITAYMAIKEGFQIYFTYKSYYRYIENYLEWFLIFAVLVACFVPLSLDATRHVAAWAMIAAWWVLA